MDRYDTQDRYGPGPAGDREDEPGRYGIREVAERLDLSLRAIRFYEQKGLVNPGRSGRTRTYDAADVEKLRFIRDLRTIGVTLREIRLLLSELERSGDPETRRRLVNRQIERRLSEIVGELDELRRQEYLATEMLQSGE